MELKDFDYKVPDSDSCANCRSSVMTFSLGVVCKNSLIDNGNDIDTEGVGVCRLFCSKSLYPRIMA